MSLKPGKVMFIDSVHPILWEKLTDLGFHCFDFTKKNKGEISIQIPDFQGVVIRSKFIFDDKLMDLSTNLQFIARSGSGLENIDTQYAKQKHIKCFNSPEGNRDAVAEHCLGMILSLFNNLIRCNLEVKNGKWNRETNRGIELKGKTIGILGYGKMGEAFAQRLKGFDVKVIALDNLRVDYSSDIVTEVKEKEFFETCDVLSLHVNYSEKNFHLINSEYLSRFKKNIYIINTSRGKSLHTKDLITHLETGKILGACLDVLEMESSSFEEFITKENESTFNKLASFENVILSPHVAGWTVESNVKLGEELAKKIKAFYSL